MRCTIPRCRVEVPQTRPTRFKWVPPAPLCEVHRRWYNRAYARRWKNKSHFGEEARFASWFSTWVQMVDEELLSELVAPPSPSRPKRYPGYTLPPIVLPEEATRAGQAAIAKRNREQAALEAQLKADVAEYARGRRMELELELRTKREAEKRKAVPQ